MSGCVSNRQWPAGRRPGPAICRLDAPIWSERPRRPSTTIVNTARPNARMAAVAETTWRPGNERRLRATSTTAWPTCPGSAVAAWTAAPSVSCAAVDDVSRDARWHLRRQPGGGRSRPRCCRGRGEPERAAELRPRLTRSRTLRRPSRAAPSRRSARSSSRRPARARGRSRPKTPRSAASPSATADVGRAAAGRRRRVARPPAITYSGRTRRTIRGASCEPTMNPAAEGSDHRPASSGRQPEDELQVLRHEQEVADGHEDASGSSSASEALKAGIRNSREVDHRVREAALAAHPQRPDDEPDGDRRRPAPDRRHPARLP